MGTMQELRDRLESGESVAAVIDSGDAPSSVYKALRQVERASPSRAIAPRQQSAAVRESPKTVIQTYHESAAKNQALAQLQVWFTVRDGVLMGLAHIDPALKCPSCGHPIRHWWVCGQDNLLIPDEDCNCPEGSPETSHGYTMAQLLRQSQESGVCAPRGLKPAS